MDFIKKIVGIIFGVCFYISGIVWAGNTFIESLDPVCIDEATISADPGCDKSKLNSVTRLGTTERLGGVYD